MRQLGGGWLARRRNLWPKSSGQEMSMRVYYVIWSLAAAVLLLAPPPANADFHLMQIEQVIGGVNGNTAAQAIQLRMRFPAQGVVSKGRLVVYNAAGTNPVVLLDILTDVTPATLGERILIASAEFAAHTTPAALPDFLLTNLIPASYLAAGSLTYERDNGSVLWRLSWGGAAYTGSTLGETTNDRDGDFGPPYSGPLPSTGTEALELQKRAIAKSKTNELDYALTDGAAVFTNVPGQSFTVTQ